MGRYRGTPGVLHVRNAWGKFLFTITEPGGEEVTYFEPKEHAADPDPKVFDTGARRSKEPIPAYSLIPPTALARLANIYKEGAAKFEAGNWQRGMSFREVIDHLLHHLFRWILGDRSEDHLAKAAWGLFALMYYEEANPSMNDLTYGKGDPNRPKAEGVPGWPRLDTTPGTDWRSEGSGR